MRASHADRTGGTWQLADIFLFRVPRARADGGKAAAGAATTKVRIGMPEAEARLILNLPEKSTDEDVTEVCAHMCSAPLAHVVAPTRSAAVAPLCLIAGAR